MTVYSFRHIFINLINRGKGRGGEEVIFAIYLIFNLPRLNVEGGAFETTRTVFVYTLI